MTRQLTEGTTASTKAAATVQPGDTRGAARGSRRQDGGGGNAELGGRGTRTQPVKERVSHRGKRGVRGIGEFGFSPRKGGLSAPELCLVRGQGWGPRPLLGPPRSRTGGGGAALRSRGTTDFQEGRWEQEGDCRETRRLPGQEHRGRDRTVPSRTPRLLNQQAVGVFSLLKLGLCVAAVTRGTIRLPQHVVPPAGRAPLVPRTLPCLRWPNPDV